MRGTLRGCDVGESVTYVVFDGDGGGQFRIHPGATPELGTSAKTSLPSEARELDLVRGGQALFRRLEARRAGRSASSPSARPSSRRRW